LVYTQLRRLSRRLGAPDFTGLTPAEVAAGVDFQIKRLEDSGRWKASLSGARDETHRLVTLYARAIYSPHAPESAEVDEVRWIWRKLRWQLWLILLAARSGDFSRK